MSSFSEKIAVFGMANLRPNDTGLPMVIWISEKSGVRHGPRIKVSLKRGDKIDPSNTVSITITKTPVQKGIEKLPAKDFALVQKFIVLNIDLLLKYWHREVSTKELILKLKSIED